jgi:hypothetical protein
MLPVLRSSIARILGPRTMGYLDYICRPELKEGFGGPFNGQEGRQAVFRDIVAACSFDSIVETGTYRGTTTEYMARHTGLPTYTVEVNPRIAGYASARLRTVKNVTIFSCDSRTAIQNLSTKITAPFCYLDAHWIEDVPLNDELVLIQRQWPDAVVMIDDFKVEDDDSYGFDNYASGKQLTLNYLDSGIKRDFEFYFPCKRGREDTGVRRGCLLLVLRDSKQATILRQIPSVRLYATQHVVASDS